MASDLLLLCLYTLWARAGLFCAVLLMTTTAISHGQSGEIADFQSWDELDVSARLARDVDLCWVSQGRFSAEFSNPATYLSGVDVKVAAGRFLEITPSYYFLRFISASDRRGHFQVPMLTATARRNWERWVVADRNRFLGAIGTGNDFWIYLNRPRVDYRIGPATKGASLFVWDEIFYFSSFHAWTRNRFAAGARKIFGERWAADAYYLRQDDRRGQPRDINGLGLTFEVRIR